MRTKQFASWFRENTPKEGLSDSTTFSRKFVKDAWNNEYRIGQDESNKWHFVKNKDLPKEDLCGTYRCYHLERNYAAKGD